MSIVFLRKDCTWTATLGLMGEGMATPSFSDKAEEFFLDKAMFLRNRWCKNT
jgi:hypothetical protein